MPFFRDIKTLKQQAREIDRTFDPGAQMRAARERMAQAQDMLEASHLHQKNRQVLPPGGRNQVY